MGCKSGCQNLSRNLLLKKRSQEKALLIFCIISRGAQAQLRSDEQLPARGGSACLLFSVFPELPFTASFTQLPPLINGHKAFRAGGISRG